MTYELLPLNHPTEQEICCQKNNRLQNRAYQITSLYKILAILLLTCSFFWAILLSNRQVKQSTWDNERWTEMMSLAKGYETSQEDRSFCSQEWKTNVRPIHNIPGWESLHYTSFGKKLEQWFEHTQREAYCNPTAKSSKFVVMNTGAGTGNRMQTLASQLVLAVLTNRALLVNWPNNSGEHGCFFHQIFMQPFPWSLNHISSHFVNSTDPTSLIFDLEMHSSPKEVVCQDISYVYEHKKLVYWTTDEYFLPSLLTNPVYRHYFWSEDLKTPIIQEDILIRFLLNYLFSPVPDLRELIDSTAKTIFPEGKCDLGVHMRMKGVQRILPSEESLFPLCAANSLATKGSSILVQDPWTLERITTPHAPLNKTIFLATDHNPYRDFFKKSLPNTNIVYNQAGVPGNITSTCGGVKSAIVDLFLLQKCDSILTTQWSSFSYMSHAMAGVAPVTVARLLPTLKVDPENISPATGCLQLPSSEPLYFEQTHLRLFSCFDKEVMMPPERSSCIAGFCGGFCLHHDSVFHRYLPLVVWDSPQFVYWTIAYIMIVSGIAVMLITMKKIVPRQSLGLCYRLTFRGYVIGSSIIYWGLFVTFGVLSTIFGLKERT
ncbi:hypothetical protein K7432_010170 [Basidiobolus ranarum]|uniref:Fucosyltransferase n=1 Tax=Basidiobolus ranarum TaxID=34480 RepID=A0ABR2VVW7_9FUNG